jgi:hypothetical protein
LTAIEDGPLLIGWYALNICVKTLECPHTHMRADVHQRVSASKSADADADLAGKDFTIILNNGSGERVDGVVQEESCVERLHRNQTRTSTRGFCIARSRWSMVEANDQSVLQFFVKAQVKNGRVPKFIH